MTGDSKVAGTQEAGICAQLHAALHGKHVLRADIKTSRYLFFSASRGRPDVSCLPGPTKHITSKSTQPDADLQKAMCT